MLGYLLRAFWGSLLRSNGRRTERRGFPLAAAAVGVIRESSAVRWRSNRRPPWERDFQRHENDNDKGEHMGHFSTSGKEYTEGGTVSSFGSANLDVNAPGTPFSQTA